MSVTSIEELKRSMVREVELPSFDGDTPFVVRMQRPSLLKLAETGAIPNQLMDSAQSLFMGSSPKGSPDGSNTLASLNEVISVLAKASMVEPTFDELTEAGIELTDEQKMAIFNYTQAGVAGLNSFRKKQERLIGSANG